MGLAQALVHEPDVLILDEPLSGLDPNQVADVRRVIRQEGEIRTVLFSSHILSDVQAIADRIIVIDKGVIVADQKLQKGRKEASPMTKNGVRINVYIPHKTKSAPTTT